MTSLKESQAKSRAWLSNRLVVVMMSLGVVGLFEVPFIVLYGANENLSPLNGEMPNEPWHVWSFALNALLLAPPLETALLAIPILLLRNRPIRDPFVAMIAATFLTLLHVPFFSNAVAVWGPFVVFAFVYVKRRRPPFGDGFVLAALIHAICNLVPVIALLLYFYFPDA